MTRLLGYLLRVVLFIAVAIWLADQPGTAHIVWHGTIIETSAAFLGLAILVLSFILYFAYRVWHIVRNGPELWRLNRQLKKMEQGHNLLTQGLVAVAAGHATEAGRLAVAARKKLGTTTATLLLQAQAAQLAHDHRSARAIFRAMIEDPESNILGYRGLIMEARRTGDWSEIERLTAEIRHLKPDVPWLDSISFESATRRKAWIEAEAALARLAPTRLLEPEILRRQHAALFIARSMESAAEGNSSEALESAEQAVKQAHDWLPALINLARRQAAGDHKRAVRRTVEKTWAVQPHPQLAEIISICESKPIDAYKQIEYLSAGNDDDPVNHLVLGEAALAADIWGEARRHLMALVNKNIATQAVYRLLSKLERRERGDERAALQWLTKATEAMPDPAWLCSSCGSAHPDWVATCRSCGAFGSLEWRSPGVSHIREHAPLTLLSNWSE